MRYLTFRHLLASLLFLQVFASCKKDISHVDIPANAKAGIPTPPLVWENVEYMPTPPGVTPVQVPWANGSVKGFTSDLWNDYHQADGWELVYNTFNTTSLQNNPFFVLYNKYRGLIRFYIYITTQGFPQSSYLTAGLNLAPNAVNSPLLNYAAADLTDVNTKPFAVSKMEPTQLSSNVWYATQFELAYDPSTTQYSYTQLGLNLTLKWTNVTSVDLGGEINGTIQGTITTPGAGFNIESQLQKGVLNAVGFAGLAQAAGPDASKPEEKNKLSIPPVIYKSIRDGLTSGLTGVAKNILNGIINGGTGPTIQSLNATVNASIKLTGTLTNGGAIFPDPGLGLSVPGIPNNTQAIGFIPAYNEPLGVFTIDQKPTVNVHAFDITNSRPSSQYNYSFSPSTVIINPAVSQVALVTVEKQELVLLGTAYRSDGVPETTDVNVGITYTNPTYAIFARWVADIPPGKYPLGIRIVVKVTPNNGSAPLKIVKTFLANEVRI